MAIKISLNKQPKLNLNHDDFDWFSKVKDKLRKKKLERKKDKKVKNSGSVAVAGD